MDKDTTDLLERLRQSASETDGFVRGMTDISCEVCEMSADTIERQAKERADFREQLRDTQGRLWSVKCSRDDARSQRDALKAEVERLSAALEARTDDLQALKIEYAVVLASSRCQLCGEMVEPPRSFCSTCCAR